MQDKTNAHSERLICTITNISTNNWRYYWISIITVILIVGFINVLIFKHLESSNKANEIAFIEGNIASIKNFVITDLKEVFKHSTNINQLSIIKNYSYINHVYSRPNIIGSTLYINKGNRSIIYDIQPLNIIINNILSQQFYYQIMINNNIMGTNVEEINFAYHKVYEIDRENFLSIKLQFKPNANFIQNNSKILKENKFLIILFSILSIILITPVIIYFLIKISRLKEEKKKIELIERVREKSTNYLRECENIQEYKNLPVILPVNKISNQIIVEEVAEELRDYILAYVAQFNYTINVEIQSETSVININYEVIVFRQMVNSILYNILYFMRGATHIKKLLLNFYKDKLVIIYDSFAANEDHMCRWSEGIFEHLGHPYILSFKQIFTVLKERNMHYEILPKQGNNKIEIYFNKKEKTGRVIKFNKNFKKSN